MKYNYEISMFMETWHNLHITSDNDNISNEEYYERHDLHIVMRGNNWNIIQRNNIQRNKMFWIHTDKKEIPDEVKLYFKVGKIS